MECAENSTLIIKRETVLCRNLNSMSGMSGEMRGHFTLQCVGLCARGCAYIPDFLAECISVLALNTLRTGDADLRFYITTVQDG